MNNDKAGVQAVLKRIRKVFPEAAVCGGWPRDEFLGKQAKDVDISIARSRRSLRAINVALREIFGKNGEVFWAAGDDEYSISESSRLDALFQIKSYNTELPVEILVINTRCTHPDLFGYVAAVRNDFGICQIWYDGEAFHGTDEFLEDLLNKRFTLAHDRGKEETAQSMLRYNRLAAKFPDYKLVIPEEMEQPFE